MNEKNGFALVRRPSSAVEKIAPGAKRILSGMVADTLSLAKRKQPKTIRPFKIVWVDDEEVFLQIYVKLTRLKFKNATVQTFQNRDEAWEELLQTDPDLLISDLRSDNVPGRTQHFGMSGLKMLSLLAERKVKYPILIVSGSLSIEGYERKARQSAGSDLNISFLTKPFSTEQLYSNLSKHFDLQQQLESAIT